MQNARLRMSRWAKTWASGRITPPSETLRPGSRSASNSVRTAWAISAMTAQAAPTASAAPCQFDSSTSGGTARPASAPPSGTPVCLTENRKPMRCAGVLRARMWELDGVIGP